MHWRVLLPILALLPGVPAASFAQDLQSPSPQYNPYSPAPPPYWTEVPTAIGATRIRMKSAFTCANDSPYTGCIKDNVSAFDDLEFQFVVVDAGGTGADTSGWAEDDPGKSESIVEIGCAFGLCPSDTWMNHEYVDDGLEPNTTYCYKHKVRDEAGNQSGQTYGPTSNSPGGDGPSGSWCATTSYSAALPSAWPLGTLVHTLQVQLSSPTYTDISGWDPVENEDFEGAGSSTPQQNKDAMTAAVPTFPVGLIDGDQPGDLLDGTPGGSCPAGATLSSANLAHLPTVDFTGGAQDVPLVKDCDFERAFGAQQFKINTGVSVAFVNSYIEGQLNADRASGAIYLFDSTVNGGDTGTQGSLYCGNDASCYANHCEILGGSDMMKLGANDIIKSCHIHAYTNVDPNEPQPHFDAIQNVSPALDSMLLDNNIEGPFRDSQNAYRGTGPSGSSAGDIIVSGNVMGGGRIGSGSSPGNGVGHLNAGTWTGDAVFWGNRPLGSASQTVGVSWWNGFAFTCGTNVPSGSCYCSENVATDGNASGNSGNAASGASADFPDDNWTDSWNAGCVAANGSTVAVPDARKADANAMREQLDLWRAEALAAAGY
jgi:hypothetical protein